MIAEAKSLLKSRTALRPAVGVVLGSGLGAFADKLSDRTVIPYGEIPGWPASTAVGHAGKLVIGSLDTLPVAVMSGRPHLYEGHTPSQVIFPIRVLHAFGVRSMVFTNAAGGINNSLEPGCLVLISDHINLQGSNPLTGPNDDLMGPRFPDMTEAYSRHYRDLARDVATELCIYMPEGVYAGLLGPSYETPAEIRFLQRIGADVVGMSTVAEVIAANHMGMKVLAVSCVTNMAAGISEKKLSHDEVIETGAAAADTLVKFLRMVLPRLHQDQW